MGDPSQIIAIAFAAVILLALLTSCLMFFQLGRPWLRAFLAGGHVSLFDIVGMRMRNTPVNLVLDTYITFVQRGEKVPLADIERCYLARRGRIMDCHDLIRQVEAERNGAT